MAICGLDGKDKTDLLYGIKKNSLSPKSYDVSNSECSPSQTVAALLYELSVVTEKGFCDNHKPCLLSFLKYQVHIVYKMLLILNFY